MAQNKTIAWLFLSVSWREEVVMKKVVFSPILTTNTLTCIWYSLGSPWRWLSQVQALGRLICTHTDTQALLASDGFMWVLIPFWPVRWEKERVCVCVCVCVSGGALQGTISSLPRKPFIISGQGCVSWDGWKCCSHLDTFPNVEPHQMAELRGGRALSSSCVALLVAPWVMQVRYTQ